MCVKVCGCSCSQASSGGDGSLAPDLALIQKFVHMEEEKEEEGECESVRVKVSFSSLLLQGQQINEAACDLAREVANEGDALVAGGVSQTPSYLSCRSEDEVKAIFKKQLDVFINKKVDFLIAEV